MNAALRLIGFRTNTPPINIKAKTRNEVFGKLSPAEVLAVVVTETVTFVGVPLAVTVCGEIVQVEYAGAPKQDMLKVPR